MKKILVIGTGYVGLITGVSLAEIGNKVTCLDIDKNKINQLRNGETPIYEPGLVDYLEKNIKKNRLKFTTEYKKSVEKSDYIYLAVGTPENEDGSANLDYLFTAVDSIKEHINDDKIIVIKSTVPVGTAQKVKELFIDVPYKVSVVSNPEFLREGSALYDAFNGDRIVIGANDNKALNKIEKLNIPFGIDIYKTSNESAEMIKYASNAFLATKISFINEIASICELVNADVSEVAAGMGMDDRIGRKFLNAGIGYGGSCFPKDTKALSVLARENGFDPIIVNSVIQRNEYQKLYLLEKYKKYTKYPNKPVGILGLAFKPNTDDLREAPSLAIIDELVKEGIEVYAYDPIANERARTIVGDKINIVDSPQELLDKVNVLFLVTEWDEFKNLQYNEEKQYELFDGRNFIQESELADNVNYFRVGVRNNV
ncbi:UDP-glucose dehydrogenase family protein [Macrococcoides bohemicum]|uniref:UDP-glucose dehydrogenase family protein n=1 Tax=Macrococcoides bohemicum TaxID=1903056 RepID=UPI00165E1D73|nr:UDP-glucose/GDP-mannose dehydrogenase family protein [Macrococcus bohemicus]MBC9875436.1 UDP-glucose/GDP-mannose dehydrogenase family protein [Macrococcus bohemicus]